MQNHATAGSAFRIASPSGLRVECNANGSVRRMDCGDILINLFLGSEAEGGLANVYLRTRDGKPDAIPLLGPSSPARYQATGRGFAAEGTWEDLSFRLQLVLAESCPAWFWHVSVQNMGRQTVTCDLIHAQDLALAHYGAVRLNEFYVCHYVDHTPLAHPQTGVSVASRQNLSMGGRYPWTLIGSLGKAVAYSTDARSFYGFSRREDAPPIALQSGLASQRLQGEHALVALQDAPFVLKPGAHCNRGFFGWFQADKPEATSPSRDFAIVDRALALPEAEPPPRTDAFEGHRSAASLFATAPLLSTLDLDSQEMNARFGAAPRHVEREGDRLLSFFTGDHTHVVLRAKELRVLRPHGIILRTGGALTPDESALTSTVWMDGVFHSMVTQGHVSINRFLSTCHSYLGLFRSHGLRVFAETKTGWRLLGIPSAFAMRPDACRWLYKHSDGLIEATVSAPDNAHDLRLSLSVLSGSPSRFLFSLHVAINGDDGCSDAPLRIKKTGSSVFVRADADSDVGRRFPDGGFSVAPTDGTRIARIGGDECLFADGVSHGQPFLCFETEISLNAGLTIQGHLVDAPAPLGPTFHWNTVSGDLTVSPRFSAALRLADFFPWLIQNALVHYLSPRGLEQYSGGGWGTRDVCQGPVELLLALGRFAPIRDILLRVFRQQNSDGDWPQWFMFFDRERSIRPEDSHGDIVFWPLLALAQYLSASGDTSLLDEVVPYFRSDSDSNAELTPLSEHVERALGLIRQRTIAGTALEAYGRGDWNDALQPARPDMREHLCSSWTVTLHYQTLNALSAAFKHIGRPACVRRLDEAAVRIRTDFQRVLIKDGVLTGLVYFHGADAPDYLLHPRDKQTGLSYSVLAMINAITADLFTPEQAKAHWDLIRQHLSGPDGAHLFDRPMPYRGGVQTLFQRMETASYFGREIGLMYTHAHLRTCEALAHFGDADGFFSALCKFNPIGIQTVVPSAALRQSNCYYSSSDPAFTDRYEAFEQYSRALSGDVALEGGWRVYSSGAGIGARLIVQNFLGIRLEAASIVIDPVVPKTLDGLSATLHLFDQTVELAYRVLSKGCGTVSAALNGTPLAFTRDSNPYRPGAARIALSDFTALLTGNRNRLEMTLG